MASSETASDDDALSAGSVLLSSVLNDNPELIKNLASCLDRPSFLTNWKDVAFKCGLNREFIERLQFDSVHSPTKQVLEYLKVTRPMITIGEVMDVLKIIKRLDICHLLEKELVPDALLKDVIDDLDLFTTIAIKLDKKIPVVKNWRHLAYHLSVPRTAIEHLEDEQQRREQESPTTNTIHALTILKPDVTIADLVKVLEELKREDAVQIIREQFPGTLETSHPSYVVARGERMMAAYRRALETGETLDKRVKIFLIGKDRAGKTSVGKSLRGERFDPEEASTDGVQMHEPLMNAGVQPWKNSKMKEETTTYHQKCAEYISKNLVTESTEGQQRQKGENDVNMDIVTERIALGKIYGIVETFEEKETIAERDQTDKDGIWPVIWDFAGQAVYRAIHPIFMSPEGVYLLVVDATKGLSAIAQCHVKEDGSGELEIQATDYYDTNLDHIMRWMDLVYSLRHSGNCKEFPPVILVGTHADCKDMPVKPDETIRILKNTLCHSARVLSQCILATIIVFVSNNMEQ